MLQTKKIQIILIIIFLFFIVSPVFAANIFFDLQNKKINPDSQFKVDVLLNTEKQDINAVTGEIYFDSDLLKIQQIQDGNSIINFWIEKKKQAKKIIFSGIIPGGYSGKSGLLFSIIFYAKKDGEAIIKIKNPRVLLNDGLGTDTKVKFYPLKINISSKVKSVMMQPKKDVDPPEFFSPIITSDPNIFNGKYFLVFATQDKGSGIDYYEVCEDKTKCIIARSPYLLKNQKLNKDIIVKAIDKNGNIQAVLVPAKNRNIGYEYSFVFAILLVIIIFTIYFFIKILWRGRKN